MESFAIVGSAAVETQNGQSFKHLRAYISVPLTGVATAWHAVASPVQRSDQGTSWENRTRTATGCCLGIARRSPAARSDEELLGAAREAWPRILAHVS